MCIRDRVGVEFTAIPGTREFDARRVEDHGSDGDVVGSGGVDGSRQRLTDHLIPQAHLIPNARRVTPAVHLRSLQCPSESSTFDSSSANPSRAAIMPICSSA